MAVAAAENTMRRGGDSHRQPLAEGAAAGAQVQQVGGGGGGAGLSLAGPCRPLRRGKAAGRPVGQADGEEKFSSPSSSVSFFPLCSSPSFPHSPFSCYSLAFVRRARR